MDISTSICGIKLNSCIMNASGCWCTTETELDELNTNHRDFVYEKVIENIY